MGDEGKLRYELLDAAQGKTPRSELWKKEQGFDSYFSGAGSQNIWLMRFATRALRGLPVPWEAVYHYQLGPPPGSSLVARNGALLTTPETISGDKVYTPGFGGSEFMSTIYWGWHLMSHLALTRKDGPIGKLARRWVTLNWALFRAIQAPDGSLLLFGQRSAGHDPKPREVDWFFALASDGDVPRAEKWCREAGAGLKQSWEFEIGNELRPEMRATWQESLAIKAEDLPALLPLRLPTDIVRTTEGLAVVHAGNCNPNTPPILAGFRAQDGRREVFPTSVVNGGKVFGGIRIRQKFDHATARIEGNEIVYASSLYTGGAEQRIALPGGAVISHLRLGGGAAVEPSGPEPEPGDPEPEPGDPTSPVISQPTTDVIPAPARDLARAADIIGKLQLPNRQKQLQRDILAQLTGSPDEAEIAAIAEQVRAFGIGQGQAQAVAWREAIAILEGPAAST